jgi:hypothetical protein
MSRGYSTNSPSAANFARAAGEDERVDRNRQASAMYAAQDAERGGPGVPAHLQQYLPGGAAFDPGRSASFGGGSGEPKAILGGYTSIRDMFDGGGRGGPGPTFQGGLMSGALNAAGISPYGQGSGTVSGFMERMGSGGAGPGPGMYGSYSIGGDNTAGALAPAPVAMPAPEMPMAPVSEAGPTQMLPPGYEMAGLGDVSADPESMFTFEEYLASLNRAPGVIPPSPMGVPAPMGQGIGSFQQPVQLMNMGGAVSAPMPKMFEDPMMRLGPRLPPVGFAG